MSPISVRRAQDREDEQLSDACEPFHVLLFNVRSRSFLFISLFESLNRCCHTTMVRERAVQARIQENFKVSEARKLP